MEPVTAIGVIGGESLNAVIGIIVGRAANSLFPSSMLEIVEKRVCRPAQLLRKTLLHWAYGSLRHAAPILARIDRLRDRSGLPLDELRHPELASELSWPRLG